MISHQLHNKLSDDMSPVPIKLKYCDYPELAAELDRLRVPWLSRAIVRKQVF